MRPHEPHSGMEVVVRTNLLLLGSYRTAQHDDNAFVILPSVQLLLASWQPGT
jgi:hypothetical protein